MSRVLGIDQSLSKAAMVRMIDKKVQKVSLLKTGSSTVKTKRKDTCYFDDLHQQIHYIVNGIIEEVSEFKPEVITFEALSFGSVGNATRSLAELYGAIRDRLILDFPDIPVYEYAPTSLKSYAKDFLKEEDQWEKDDQGKVILLKSKKPKKVKMDKKMMVKAIKDFYGEDYLKGYNYSSGLDDLADATFLALKVTDDHYKGT